MTQRSRWAAVLAMALGTMHGASVRAQWAYPAGYGGVGWGGWGGAQTPGGSLAQGMGAFAAGAGSYNVQTAQARSINADTAMKFNEYMDACARGARRHAALIAGQSADINNARSGIQAGLRNNPSKRDVYMGDALNLAVEEIQDPRVYSKSLKKAKVAIGGKMIRDIPFRKAAVGVTTSLEHILKGPPPGPLLSTAFDDDRAAMKSLAPAIKESINKGEPPDPATVEKALAIVVAMEAKAERALPIGVRENNEAHKFLKAVHGLLGMLQTPALSVILAGVENHPEATLGELLAFMSSYNLRFGQAKTPAQQRVYDVLYPMLVDLRDEVGPALASTAPSKVDSSAVGEFFSAMSYDDLRKKAPAPPRPGGGR